MSLASMTGFARAQGASGPWRWTVEIKCVNAKGLDLRLRLPPGFDRIEAEARARLAKVLVRGTAFATVAAQREGATLAPRVNKDLLGQLATLGKRAAEEYGLAPPTLDGLMSLRGVVDVDAVTETETETETANMAAAMLRTFDEAVAAIVVARRSEGAALHRVLSDKIDAIAAIARAADDNPARKPDAVRARLAQQVAALGGSGFDEVRLYQEALILAAKADIREELDRLHAHVAAARSLLAEGGPVGRRLDFLAQEFGREANTLCAKSNDSGLTSQGLELRAQIEQLREQVQNIE